MMGNDLFWDYLPYHLGNYLLAALMYTAIGRMLLQLFVPPNTENNIMRLFIWESDPVLPATRVITPRFVQDGLLPLVAIFWIIFLRVVFWILMTGFGMTPSLSELQ